MAKVLLDEGVPRPLVGAFPMGTATTVDLLGWKGMKNGVLLRRAAAEGFDVFVTCDKNLPHQNSPRATSRLAIVVLPFTDWPKLKALQPAIVAAVLAARPGTVSELPDTRSS